MFRFDINGQPIASLIDPFDGLSLPTGELRVARGAVELIGGSEPTAASFDNVTIESAGSETSHDFDDGPGEWLLTPTIEQATGHVNAEFRIIGTAGGTIFYYGLPHLLLEVVVVTIQDSEWTDVRGEVDVTLSEGGTAGIIVGDFSFGRTGARMAFLVDSYSQRAQTQMEVLTDRRFETGNWV